MNEAVATVTSSSAAALQTFFASGVVLVSVLLCGLNGVRIGLFRSILSFAAFVTAAVTAFAWGASVGGLVERFGVPEGWSLVAGYVAVLCLVLGLMPLLIRFLVRAEVMTYATLLDRLGGALVGAAAGLLLASVVRVGFAMAPVSAAARPTPEQLQADVTPRALRMISRILSSDAAVRRAWLYGGGTPVADGEPAAGQVRWSEPYVDLNANDHFDGEEPFLDKDGNGRFTTAFAAGDAEADRDPRVGVMDRYWLGNWRLVRVMESSGAAAPRPGPVPATAAPGEE